MSESAISDRARGEVMAAIEKFRKLEGEREFNHMLRNLLQQSNAEMMALGCELAEPEVDHAAMARMKMAADKASQETELAWKTCREFGAALKNISNTDGGADHMKWLAGEALKWRPGQTMPDGGDGIEEDDSVINLAAAIRDYGGAARGA